MSDLFYRIVIGGDYTEGVRFRRSLWAMPRPMSGGLFMAETTLERPATIHRMTPFSTEFALECVSSGFLSPVYILPDDDFFGAVFVGREVDNSNLGISNTIRSVSDWIVI